MSDLPYFEVQQRKRKRRKAERTWLSEKSEINTQLLQSARSTVNKQCATAYRDYYQAKIEESAGDQKALYKVTDKLLGKNKTRQLPDHEDRKVLANGLAGYFKQKIDKLQETFPQNQQNTYVHHDSTIPSLNTLSTVTEDEVRKIIMSGNSKSCALDPIPTKLLKIALIVSCHLLLKLSMHQSKHHCSHHSSRLQV